MKRGTPNHPKTRALARTLGICRAHAVGILEMLWHFTAEYAPDGSLAKFGPEEIAEAVAWTGDVPLLLKALHDGWLDEDNFVHDWPTHCDEFTHCRLVRQHGMFACGCTPRESRMPVVQRTGRERVVCARHATPKRLASAPQALDECLASRVPLPVPLPVPVPVPLRSSSPSAADPTPLFKISPEEIFELYPLKDGRVKALAAITKALSTKELAEAARAAGQEPDFFLACQTDRFAREVQANHAKYHRVEAGAERCFIPHATTWYSECRYLDHVDTGARA